MNAPDENKMHMVLIEWDGEAPPTQWYRKMHALAGKVRGDKSKGVLARRVESNSDTSDPGIIFQEGCILCPSESLAETLAFYVRDVIGHKMEMKGKRPPTVMVGNCTITSSFTQTPLDTQYLSRISRTLGRRGRKPPMTKYAVTCHEDMGTYNDEKPKGHAITCPLCGGFAVNVREGSQVTFKDEENTDLFTYWLRTRFFGSHWEVAQIGDHGKTAPAVKDLYIGGKEEALIDGIKGSTQIMEAARDLAKTDRQEALDLFDTIFVSRLAHKPQRRLKARINVIQNYVTSGGTMDGIMIAEMPVFDLLDASRLLGVRRTTALMMKYVHQAKGGK